MKGSRYLSGLLCGVVFICGPAYSQVSSQGQAAGAPAAGSSLTEIVVTAQHVVESSQRAAIAIQVIQPGSLAQVTDPQDLTKLAPALQIANAGGSSPLLYVRGVGTFSVNPYTDSAVAVNYDGIYLGRPTSAFGMFYDLARIEVLKGPQGTLYGRNATGGALNILPAPPKLDVQEGSATFSYGNYNALNGQAAVNLPISDKAAVRFAGVTYSHDGYNTDGTYTESGQGGRAQLLLTPSDTVSLRVGADYFHLGGTGPTGFLLADDNAVGVAVPYGLGPNVGLFDPRSRAALNSAFVGIAGTTYGQLQAMPHLNNRYYGVNGELNADLGFGTLTVIAGWRRSDLDDITTPNVFDLRAIETDNQYSLETRLLGNLGAVDWLVGAYGFDQKQDATFLINGNLSDVDQNLKQDSNSYAGFARLTYHVTDTFRLTGAVRDTKDDKKFDGVSNIVIGICESPTHVCPGLRPVPANVNNQPAALASIGFIQPVGFPVYIDTTGTSNAIYLPSQIPVNEKMSSDKLTYRAAAEFEPRPGSMLYASIETGYRAGGFAFSSIQPAYKPETITAYTIGTKNRFLDNRLQLNIEGFYWNYKDQQISHQTINPNGGIEFITENIGASTNKGVEVELTAKPARNTMLYADLQYLDAKNDRFVFTDPDLSGLAGLPPGTAPPPERCPYKLGVKPGTYQVDCSGLRALRSPEWTFNLGMQQTFDLSNGFNLSFEGNTHHQTSDILMFERRAFSVQGGYWQSDAAVNLSHDDKRWSWTVGVFVNNIENNRVLTSSYWDSFSGITTGNPGPPRTYGARLSVRF